ncbi:MarR family winged helix-turn-helix transcriptional regulator [Streptomyces phyllanthi]|uniref:Winged helix-turn-helix transcriptional regulator n=1 Tax=Streptomyces phyllanthi TaxID=1803180 RepID=A0A5N8WHR0_9ACTN|nr:MarR family winged helix-turn-helix transcriptional regulator [Streptomyces phyllanthi]MPY45755.1 winged helix-turn-helix transcriptional regulator [Streptomyces phyllanthi]
MTETPRWLSPAQQNAWRCFVRMQEKLNGRVSRDLQAESCLSAADYRVLVHLADAPDGRMRSSDLARSVEWEQSRMSHQVARMVKRGLVCREGCFKGGRGTFVVITPDGRRAIAEAAPRHVETVRRLFIDLLTPDELRTLARVSRRVVEQLEK